MLGRFTPVRVTNADSFPTVRPHEEAARGVLRHVLPGIFVAMKREPLVSHDPMEQSAQRSAISASKSGDAIKEALARFQGGWKQVAYERDGVRQALGEQGDPSTTVNGFEFVVTRADGSVPCRGTVRIDPTRNPKTVGWTDTIGEDAGKTLLAI